MKDFLKPQFTIIALLIGLWLPAASQDTTTMSTTAAANIATAEGAKPMTGISGYRTFSVGVNGGLLSPVAAIGGSNDFTNWKPTFGYGFYLKNQFRHWIALQLDFLKGTLEGNNDNTLGNGQNPPNRFSSFTTDLNWAASLSSVITLGNVNWLSEKNAVIPYVSVGAGLASYNPTLTTNANEKIEYKPNGSIKEFFVPVGGGLKISASPGLNIDLGYRMHFVDGDNLNGYVMGIHKDRFSYGFAGLEFVIGNKAKPQLMTHNPAAQLRRDLMDENNALRASVEATQQQRSTEVTALRTELENLKKDSDKDGVADHFDKCPGTADSVKVDGAGCPLPKVEVPKPQTTTVIVTEEDRRIVREAIRNLEFDLGKAVIRERSFASLDKVAEILVNKNFSLKLAGHTDNIGSDAANLRLSKDRAESVKEYLVSKGANPSRIEATGYGESQPIASNKTAKGRQQNRRVEFTLY